MDQFDQLLTCAICLDRYRNPKLLPCQHSFCMEPCMEGLVDYVRRQVKCPECRAEHRIPYNGVQAFPTNVTLTRFLELHIELTGEIPDPTTNQVMERCQVCSEKAYCLPCAHCEKKVCSECKEAHMDVLKREISRISNQVRRVLHRLEDALGLADKNSLLLQQNSLSVMEEIDDIYRRLAKALKDRSEFMKHEVERYLQTELKNLTVFKYNMEQEVGNITSNCDLVDKYVAAECPTSHVWDDGELMDTKDIFLKTMEFIRSFEYEPGDYARRVRFVMTQDPNTLTVTLGTYGDLHLPSSNSAIGQSSSSNQLSAHPSQSSQAGLMRSKSDHRLTTQYRGPDYDEPSGRTSPVFGRKFGERERKEPKPYPEMEHMEVPERKSRFRSRFTRNLVDSFEDPADGGSKGVRFTENESRKERERVLDTEDVARGPLSGITRLLDSPRVIQRVQEAEAGPKPAKVAPPPPVAPVVVAAPVVPWRAASRQVSEEDEITKQKKANKLEAASSKAQPTNVVPPARRQTSTEPKTPVERTAPSRTPSESVETGSTDTGSSAPEPAIPAGQSAETTARLLARKLSPERFPKKNRSESSDSATSETSSGSSPGRTGAAFSTDEVRQRFLSKSTNSDRELSSGRTTPQQQQALRKDIVTGSGSGSGVAGTRSGSGGPTTPTTPTGPATRPAFQSRFLGRTQTPTVEAKEEEDSSSSEEEESESSEEEVEEEVKPPEKLSRMEKTDIGPLLARSAHERERNLTRQNSTSSSTAAGNTSYKKESPPSVASYRRTRDAATRVTSPPERETGRYTAPTTTAPTTNYSSGRYNARSGTGDYGGSSLARSRSTVYSSPPEEPAPTTPSRYSSGLANKYLNRSRHTFDDDTPAAPTPRYGTTTSSSYSRPSYLSKQEHARGSKLSSAKDKKAKVSKSKSSHDVLGGVGRSLSHNEPMEDMYMAGTSRAQRRRKASLNPNNEYVPGEENGSLSSWARYLKTKYGKGKSFDSATGPPGAEEVVERPKRHSFSTPAHQYLNKNRVQFKFGSRGSEPGKLTWPRGICCCDGPDGTVQVVVADSTNHRICVFDEAGNFVKEFGSYGSGDGEFDCPGAVWVNRIGQFIVSDRYNHRVQVFDPSGRFLRAFGSQGEAPGKFSYPLGVTTDALNFIYVCEESRIQVFQSDGTFVGKFGTLGSKVGELSHPHYIAVTSTNKVVVSDTNNSRIQIFDVNGKVLTCFGSEGSEDGLLKSPRGVAVDESGFIVVGDSGNNRIQIFSPDGVFLKSFGSWGSGDQEFKGLEGLAVANGNIYAVDRVNHSISVL